MVGNGAGRIPFKGWAARFERFASDLRMYGRFARSLRLFLAHTVAFEDARRVVTEWRRTRRERFLLILRRGIFENPRSPYLPLLKAADCAREDLDGMVLRDGIESTLLKLRKAGVYVTFEEFKGRRPIIRNGLEYVVGPEDFDNPWLGRDYYAETSGSTGAGSRVWLDLDHLEASTFLHLAVARAHGFLGLPTLVWMPVLPSSAGLNNLLRGAKIGNTPRRWFTPVGKQDLDFSLRYRLTMEFILATGRMLRKGFPRPEPLAFDEAHRLARAAAELARSHGGCLVRGYVSLCLRTALAALDEGIDLSGVVFCGGGEPATGAKVARILETGARWVPTYAATETGIIGAGCASPADGNDIHLFRDSLALLTYPRELPEWGVEVRSFHFTSLLPTAPKLFLNVESDDCGVIERRRCGCYLEELGYLDHLLDIRSFRKMTGQGMSLLGTELEEILETVLPKHFGGTPLDYQFQEDEDGRGLTRVYLLVHPRLSLSDENQVLKTVYDHFRKGSPAARLARAVWSRSDTLQIRRAVPMITRSGKHLPLCTLARRVGVPAETP